MSGQRGELEGDHLTYSSILTDWLFAGEVFSASVVPSQLVSERHGLLCCQQGMMYLHLSSLGVHGPSQKVRVMMCIELEVPSLGYLARVNSSKR